MRKKDYKALFLIHQCVDLENFEKVGDVDSWRKHETSWKNRLGDAEKVKEVTLQAHKRIYEFFHMEENESITYFFIKVMRLVNKIKSCGEVLTSRSVFAKILRSLLLKFDHVVVVIEESKDLSSMCVSIFAKSLESQNTMTLGCQLLFRHLIFFTTNASFKNIFSRVLIWLTIWINHVCVWFIFSSDFILKKSYLWVNVSNFSLFTLAVPSWVNCRMFRISFAISQWETRKKSIRLRVVVIIVFNPSPLKNGGLLSE